MIDNIDVDASPLIYGGDLKEMGDELLKLLVEVASGKQTKAESLAIPKWQSPVPATTSDVCGIVP